MKLAFTTLGCPDWDISTIISKALEYGFDGVDFRGYMGNLNLYEIPEFTTDILSTAHRFTDAGIEVPCFSSSVRVFSSTPDELNGYIQEVRNYAEICRNFRAPFIRVFGGDIGDTPRAEAIGIMAENLMKLLAGVEDYDVQLLIETHDDWVDAGYLRPIMETTGSKAAGILWDTHHPYRIIGEAPEKTWEQLGKWIRYTHWKDSCPDPENHRGYQLCLIGNGDIPLADIFALLRSKSYDGYLTLEWEKKWAPELDEPEIAFPVYVKYMRKLMETV